MNLREIKKVIGSGIKQASSNDDYMRLGYMFVVYKIEGGRCNIDCDNTIFYDCYKVAKFYYSNTNNKNIGKAVDLTGETTKVLKEFKKVIMECKVDCKINLEGISKTADKVTVVLKHSNTDNKGYRIEKVVSSKNNYSFEMLIEELAVAVLTIKGYTLGNTANIISMLKVIKNTYS